MELSVGYALNLSRSRVFLALSLMTWSLTAVVLSNAYTGKIVSDLLVPSRFAVVDTLEELPASPLDWLLRRGTLSENLFMVVTSNTTDCYTTIITVSLNTGCRG